MRELFHKKLENGGNQTWGRWVRSANSTSVLCNAQGQKLNPGQNVVGQATRLLFVDLCDSVSLGSQLLRFDYFCRFFYILENFITIIYIFN